MKTTDPHHTQTNRRPARPARGADCENTRTTVPRELAPTKAVGVAGVAQRALRSVAAGRLAAFPFAIQFWDGSVLPAGADADRDGAPTLVLRDRQAVSELLHEPNEIGLTRAWVRRSLDVEGDLEAVLALREGYAGLHLPKAERARLALAGVLAAGPGILRRPPAPEIETRPRGRRHSVARDREAVRHHYELSNRFYELMLGPSMVY